MRQAWEVWYRFWQVWDRHGICVGRGSTHMGRCGTGMGHVWVSVHSGGQGQEAVPSLGDESLCLGRGLGVCGRSGEEAFALALWGCSPTLAEPGCVPGGRHRAGKQSAGVSVSLRPGPHLPCSCSPHTGSRVCAAEGTGHRVHSHSSRAPSTRWSPQGRRPSHIP